MDAAREREFSPGEAAQGAAWLESPPPDVRVYVDEWDRTGWRFVCGDDRRHAGAVLSRVKPDTRFCVRCDTFVDRTAPERTPPPKLSLPARPRPSSTPKVLMAPPRERTPRGVMSRIRERLRRVFSD